MDSTNPKFAHRVRIWSVDSICTECHLTVARAETESELSELEGNHRCEGLDLDDFIHEGNQNQNSPEEARLSSWGV
jgi:hypothetical protein